MGMGEKSPEPANDTAACRVPPLRRPCSQHRYRSSDTIVDYTRPGLGENLAVLVVGEKGRPRRIVVITV